MSADPVLRVLMVDDDPNDVLLAERALRRSGYSVIAHRIDTAEGLSAALTEQAWDLVISDYRMPTFSGLEALAIVRRSLDVPFILMSGVVGEETAVAALQAGADDYILKDNLGRLVPSVRRALRETAERRRRRQAEDALRASESRYRSLVETSPDAIVLLDLHGTIQMANRQAAVLFHHESPETLLGRNAIGLLVPSDHERAAAALQATGAGAATSPHVYTAMTRDGATFTLELQASRVLAADAATVESIMIVARNITERTRAVERLRFQADLLETVGQAIIATDVAGVITYWNRAAEALYGWPAAEVLGLNILSILPTEPFRPHGAETLASVVRGGPSTGEYLARHRNGRAIPILTSAVPVHDEEGAVIGVIGVSTDISTRVRAEEAVRQSAAQARAQFQGLPVPTYTWQRKCDEWILVDYNRAAERITSGTIHGLLGREVRTLYKSFPEILDNFTRCWREKTTIEQTMPYHFQLTNMDRHLLISYVFVPPDMILVHTIDVTERERAQAAAARHVEQLSALRAIDTAIMNSLDLRHTLDILLAQIAAQLRVDAAQILLLNTHTGMLEYRAGRGFWGGGLSRVSLRLGQGLAGQVGLERRMICVPAPASEDHTRSTLLTVEQFVGYVGAPLIAKGQLHGVLELFHRTLLAPEAAWLDFLATLAGQVALAIDNATLFTDLQQSNTELVLAYDTTIEGWSRALDLRDKETEGHSKRVTSMTLSLAQAMGLTDAELVHVRRGALLHDIGKMGVPDAILHKPGPLTDEEWIVMRKHPVYAYDLLSPIDYLRPALDIPYSHHEKWDGTGYPRGLVGEQIPFAARLFAVVDVADALLSDRPYRAGWPADRVRRHIASLSGSHFDPAVVDAFMQLEEPAARAAGFSLIA